MSFFAAARWFRNLSYRQIIIGMLLNMHGRILLTLILLVERVNCSVHFCLCLCNARRRRSRLQLHLLRIKLVFQDAIIWSGACLVSLVLIRRLWVGGCCSWRILGLTLRLMLLDMIRCHQIVWLVTGPLYLIFLMKTIFNSEGLAFLLLKKERKFWR